MVRHDKNFLLNLLQGLMGGKMRGWGGRMNTILLQTILSAISLNAKCACIFYGKQKLAAFVVSFYSLCASHRLCTYNKQC